MSLVINLFEKCLSPNNELRKAGEQELFNYCNQNFYLTLSESCSLIVNDESPLAIRQFSGTFLKYIFSHENYILLWNSLSKEQIEFVKTSLMGSLASEKQEIRQTCSLAIAALGRIEIPKGWNVIEVLFNTSHHENDNYRITSLLTFKNIMDFMGFRLGQEEINKILAAFTDNMDIKLSQNVLQNSVFQFQFIIPYIENNFKNDTQREYIIDSLNNILNNINQVSFNENIQKNILIIFIEIMKHYAKYMYKSFSKIAETFLRYFHNNSEELATLAIEIWCTLCDSEMVLKNNILSSNYQDTLSDSIIRIIQERDESTLVFDETNWNKVRASISLISCLVTVGNKKIAERMLNFISDCLNNDLLKKSEINFTSLTKAEKINALIIKQNAFLIYRGILYYQELNSEVIMSSLQKIISELKNVNSFIIGESIAFCLIVFCNFHYDLINNDQKIFEQFFEQIFQLLEIHIDNKRIELRLLGVMKLIILNSHPEYLNKYLTSVINLLINIAYAKNSYDKDCNVTLMSLFLIGKIIEVSDNNEGNIKIINDFFSKLYTMLEQSLIKNNFNSLEEQYCFQNNLIANISSCINGDSPKVSMNAIQINCVFELIEKAIIQRNGLFIEAITALGNLGAYGWEIFSVVSDRVMKYILLAIEDKQDYYMCFQGLLAADDIIRSIGGDNIFIIKQVVEKMQKLIKDPEIPRGLKIKCFLLYNDIFMIHDNSIGEYLSEVMQLLVDGMNSSIKPPDKETDNDTLEYLSEFRIGIVDLLTSVFLFLTDYNQTNAFSPYIDGFIKYLSKIVEPEFNPDDNLISSVGGLLADLYNNFKGAVNLYLNQNSLKIIFQKLEKSKNSEHKQILLYVQQTFSDFCFYN